MKPNNKRCKVISDSEAAAVDAYMQQPTWPLYNDAGQLIKLEWYGQTVEDIHGMTGVTPSLITSYLKSLGIKPTRRKGERPYMVYSHCPITGWPVSSFRDSKLNI